MLSRLSLRPLLVLSLLVAPLGAAPADPLPAEIYAAPPRIDEPRLSPDGKAVAMLAAKEGRIGVQVWHTDGAVDWFMPAEGDQINWVAWKGADRVVLSLRATEFEGGGSHAVGVSRLVFSSTIDKQSTKVLFHEPAPMGNVIVIGREGYHPPNVQDRIISLLPDDPAHILLAASADDWAHPQAMLVDVASGAPHMMMRSSGNVVKWLADDKGTIRLKTVLEGRDESSVLLFYARDDDRGDWRQIRRYEVDRGPRFVPLAFSKLRPSVLLALADQDNGRLALQEFDTRSLAPGPVLAADPHCDIDAVLRNNQVIGYRNPCRDEGEIYFDAGWQKDQAALRRALKTPLVEIVDRTPDGRYALIKSAAARYAPPSYWYFDQSGEAKTLVHIADSYEQLKPDHVAPAREVTISARDGLALPALLTLPPGRSDGPLGFVVLPHGGPNAHDSQQFDWMVQFIASRGYGVLQPQFRGSTGYGAAFQRAGYRQWGGKMQDDVTDATRWLIDQKLADPKRMCIVGSSYGGYAALVGAAQHPGLYQCVAALAPVTDMERLLKDRAHLEFGEINRLRVAGDLDPAAIPSPVDLADRIAAPVLLIHGRRDFTVPMSHSEEMERSLRRAGHNPIAVYLDDTDHFFSQPAGRLQTLKALGAFLDANLGSGLQGPPS